jgi:hypothetical protein
MTGARSRLALPRAAALSGALAALMACSAPPEQAEAPPAAELSPAPASRWPADYAAMRTAAHGFAADIVAAEAERMASAAAGGFADPQQFDTFDCSEPDAEPVELPAAEQQKILLAHQAVVLEARLKAAGYSPDVWQGSVDQLQSQILALLDGPVPAYGEPAHEAFEAQIGNLWQQATAAMELNRQTLQPEAPPIMREGGCGAAETPFRLVADPPGGRVWLATRFAFQTCQALGKPGWDRAECRWTEMAPDRAAYLSGNYMVQAEWPDGRSLKSSQKFQGGAESGEEPVTVAIRPG